MEETDGYMEKLRAVFDLCDEKKEGYISVEHFVDLAKEYFGAEGGEAVTGIVQVLDPNGTKKIQFSEFCQGVQQILELKGTTPPTTPVIDCLPPVLHASVETLVAVEEDANSCGTHDTSEISTYNEYDMMTDDDNVTLANNEFGLPSPSPDNADSQSRPIIIHDDDHDSAISAKSEHEYRREQEITDDEERFEDYGESENELTSQSSDKTKAEVKRSPDSGDIASSRKGRRRGNHLKYHRTQTLNGSSLRVTSSLFASHLLKSGSSAGNSRRSSASSELFEDIDGSFHLLNDKVKFLETQISALSDGQIKNDTRHVRLKEENSFLVGRVHTLEEQLREVEVKSNEQIQTEQKRHREFMAKTDKEKTTEIEILAQSLHHIENDYQSLKEECPRLRLEVDRLRRENHQLEVKLSQAEMTLVGLKDQYSEQQEKAQSQKADAEQERDISSQLLDELTKELEELRNYKVEHEKKHVMSADPGSRLTDMEKQIVHLRQVNKGLKDQNEELQAQLLNNKLEEGRSLLHNGAEASLADEIENLPRDDLMKALLDQQEVNRKLKEYVDSIMLKILEKNPSILEVPEKEKMNGKKKKKGK